MQKPWTTNKTHEEAEFLIGARERERSWGSGGGRNGGVGCDPVSRGDPRHSLRRTLMAGETNKAVAE